ncbi:hypothetical protein Naga_101601g2 [Nannochloropsis gaditana]|uniref:Uncharacterized protein n=1 Tax=Nannochloropsis gaditana TaxID=72520 RepID=W7TJN1_9STRA|nr:hypothetical protein Naga_101601g2 [Nannochloropsis gaditana]
MIITIMTSAPTYSLHLVLLFSPPPFYFPPPTLFPKAILHAVALTSFRYSFSSSSLSFSPLPLPSFRPPSVLPLLRPPRPPLFPPRLPPRPRPPLFAADLFPNSIHMRATQSPGTWTIGLDFVLVPDRYHPSIASMLPVLVVRKLTKLRHPFLEREIIYGIQMPTKLKTRAIICRCTGLQLELSFFRTHYQEA